MLGRRREAGQTDKVSTAGVVPPASSPSFSGIALQKMTKVDDPQSFLFEVTAVACN